LYTILGSLSPIEAWRKETNRRADRERERGEISTP